jgi:DNA polymerase I-like protein with 3'-5' exonuclease and polymerase domains
MIEDTRDFRRALSSTSRLSLLYLASIYTDFEPWKEGDEEDDAKGIVFTDDQSKLLQYNALDTIVTARAYARMREEWLHESALDQARITRLYERNKWKSVKAAEMHTVGFGVDHENRAFMDWGLGVQAEEESQNVATLVDVPTFRCTPNDLRKLIFKRHETPEIHRFSLPDPVLPEMYTEKGAISVGNDALTQLLMDPMTPEELKKIIKAFWQAESTKKARSTFIASDLISQAIGEDGRLRPGWNSLGAETGRWSCSDPNIMNLEQYLRAMYGVKPGRVLVHADFNQLEIWVRQVVTGDRALAAALATGDLYTADAINFFGLPPTTTKKTMKKAARDLCKMLHLATQYTAGIAAIYTQILGRGYLDVKYAQVAKYHDYFRRKYPDTVEYWKTEHAKVLACGYSETRIYNQRRFYPREPPPTETVNFPIQGTAAEVADIAMMRVDARLKREKIDANLVVQLHDAFDVDAPAECEQLVRSILTEEMERPIEIEGKEHIFRVEVKASRNWADL